MEATIQIVALGFFATAIIDIWATFSNKVFNFPRTNWSIVGRWLGHIPEGKLTHGSIRSTREIPYEHAIGWVFHYFIGVLYTFIYVAVVQLCLNGAPSLISAWVFGLITILSPWFIMQPCLGMGIAASKAPEPNMVRLQNFAIHSIFGLALYYGWHWGSDT
ncbi:MAG: DUF2938 domain-containing protein [Agarilytica sp.]